VSEEALRGIPKRSAYQDQHAEGLITLDELLSKLATLVDVCSVALKELEGVMNFDPEAVASWHGQQKTIPKRRF
jgi:hypothetical protein